VPEIALRDLCYAPPVQPTGTVSSLARIGHRRALVAGVAVFCVLVAGAVVVANFWLHRWLRSEDFQRFLETEISTALHADAHLAPLRWEGTRLESDSFEATGNGTGSVAKITAGSMRTEFAIAPLLRGVWRLDGLQAQKVALVLGDDDRPRLLLPAPKRKRSESAASRVGGEGGRTSWRLPTRFELGHVRIADFSLSWNPAQPARHGELSGVALHAQPAADGARNTYEIDGRGGHFAQANFPAAALDALHLRASDSALLITGASAHLDAGGSVQVTGSQTLTGDRALDLDARFTDVPLAPFLPTGWRARLHGLATGHLHLAGPVEDLTQLRAAGQIELRGGKLEALPFLDELAVFNAAGRYRSLPLQKSQADFVWSASRLEVTHLQLESNGLLRLEGNFLVEAGQIHGEFQVGVARSAVRWLAGTGARVFDGPERNDGYAWTTMQVSGPADSPREDLSSRLLAAAREEAFDKARKAEGKVRNWLDALRGR
jgi:hypothetical protein